MAVNYVHLIPTLDAGGAERQLCNLAISEQAAGLQPKVVVLNGKNTALRLELEHAGVDVSVYPLSGVAGLFNMIKLLSSLIRLNRHNYVLAAWMYHSCFISLFVKLLHPRLRIFWMIRRTAIPGGLTGKLCRLNARFSRLVPSVIVSNSVSGLNSHINAGYCPDKFIHIPNIIDCKKFVPTDNKALLRSKLDIPGHTRVFACVARYAPVKGHLELLQALKTIVDENFICLLIGRGVKDAPPLAELLTELVQAGRVRVLGESSDIASILPAVDFLVMPSLSEGFPNVVAEAMACAVPCIVTDVGDALAITADTGCVVPPSDPYALAHAIKKWLNSPEQTLAENGLSATGIINTHYSLETVRLKYRMLADSEQR